MSNKKRKITTATSTETTSAVFADHFQRPNSGPTDDSFTPVIQQKSTYSILDVVVTKQPVTSIFKDEYRIIRIDTLEPMSGTRLIHASSTVVEGDMFFETRERLIVGEILGVIETPAIQFLAESHSRFVKSDTPPEEEIVVDTSVGSYVMLESDAWMQEETRLEIDETQRTTTRSRIEWEARTADPARYPCMKLRACNSKVSGGNDGAFPYCLGIVVFGTKLEIRVRKFNRRMHSDTVLDDTTEYVTVPIEKIVGNFKLGIDFDIGREVVVERIPMEPLRTLDIFAGCGGLSEGLRQSGYTRDVWAIEVDKTASRSFQSNFKDAIVFNEDCNDVLARAIRGEESSSGGKRLPKKGEVQVIVGGPPCKSYSGLNRFPKTEKFKFSKSLVGTHISFCDFYRPQLFLMENVQNLGNMDGGKVLRLCVTALLTMGYQVSFTVLQAGRLGAPQSRRRLIMIAVPLGMVLPRFPKPTHTFTNRCSSAIIKPKPDLSLSFGTTSGSGMYRRVTVQDAIGDLSTMDGTYAHAPMTDYQKWMRSNPESACTYNEVRVVTPINEARMACIPIDPPGSDWRDIPNDVVRLRNGEDCKRMVLNEDGGVDPTLDQPDTLIPYCLIKTAQKNSVWMGAYSRLYVHGHFQTTLTRPEPKTKLGTCIHPTLNRLCSVREWARSQSFPDSFVFEGSNTQKYVVVGNAVSVAMARALGLEFKKTHQG